MAYGKNIFGNGVPLGADASTPTPVGRAFALRPSRGYPGRTSVESEIGVPAGRYNSDRPAGASIFGNEVYSDSASVSSVPTTLQGLGADKTVRVGGKMPVSQTAEMAKHIGGANYGPSEYDGGVFGDFPVPVGSALAVTNTYTAEDSIAPARYVDSARNGGVFGDFPVPVGAALTVAPMNYGRAARGGVFSGFGATDSRGCSTLKGQTYPSTWTCSEPNALLMDVLNGYLPWKGKQMGIAYVATGSPKNAVLTDAIRAKYGKSYWYTWQDDVASGAYLPGFGVHAPSVGGPSGDPNAPPDQGVTNTPPAGDVSHTGLYVGLALTALVGIGGFMWWKKKKKAA